MENAYFQHIQKHPQIHLKKSLPLSLQLQTILSLNICLSCVGLLPEKDTDSFGNIQRDAARFINSDFSDTSELETFRNTPQQIQPPLQHRRHLPHLMIFYKVAVGLVPAILANQFPTLQKPGCLGYIQCKQTPRLLYVYANQLTITQRTTTMLKHPVLSHREIYTKTHSSCEHWWTGAILTTPHPCWLWTVFKTESSLWPVSIIKPLSWSHYTIIYMYKLYLNSAHCCVYARNLGAECNQQKQMQIAAQSCSWHREKWQTLKKRNFWQLLNGFLDFALLNSKHANG